MDCFLLRLCNDMMQDILVKGELLRESALTDQKKESQLADGIVLDSGGGMHGVGLMNVKAVVDKYGGDFAISCDQEKFQAVVML